MNSRLLIDSIVRQTMVLIAQVATTAGVRTPLAHVARQVFMDLTQALEQQGLGQKVVADMFGLALRSYQQKVGRLAESATSSGVSLWEAVHGYLVDHPIVSRTEVLRRFANDDAISVAGVLHDMVESGLVYKTGRGDAVVYRVAPQDELEGALRDDPRAQEALVWVTIYRDGPLSDAALREQLPLSAEEVEHVLSALLADGRVQSNGEGSAKRYRSEHVLLPLGETAGWEAGLLDHHRAVIAAICGKLRNGKTQALPADHLGGSTFSFDVWRGHPCEERVLSLLAEQRRAISALWNEVSAHNASARIPEDMSRVTFYFGQLVVADEADEPNGKES